MALAACLFFVATVNGLPGMSACSAYWPATFKRNADSDQADSTREDSSRRLSAANAWMQGADAAYTAENTYARMHADDVLGHAVS